MGWPEEADGRVYNAAAVVADGGVQAVYRKMLLPNYGVFDERRWFEPGHEPLVVDVAGTAVGITVCEDIWEPEPTAATAAAGAEVVVNLSASPYHHGKGMERERMITELARDNGVTMAFCNLVGGQDELVFDGHSLIVDPDGEVTARGPQFDEALVTAGNVAEPLGPEEEVYRALVTGVRDYVDEERLRKGRDRIVGRDRLRADRARGGRCSRRRTGCHGHDAVAVFVRGHQVGCAQAFREPRRRAARDPDRVRDRRLRRAARDAFAGREPDITEENLQARVRGNIVMALSNKFGWLVLTTGNKSEMSVGYATLYGDMAGGFAVLKDVFKQWVYRLVRWRNVQAGRELVPASVLERPPSAELRDEQRDDQSLPPYDVLDAILEGYVENDLDAGS